MILDCHIHALPGQANSKDLVKRMRAAGIAGGVVLSTAPVSYGGYLAGGAAEKRLEGVLEWTAASPQLYPFFWIDPLEPTARKQVSAAVHRGVAGFKVICTHYAPGDRRAMKIYAAIAETGRPILFHAGILWNGRASSAYNRPAEFEALLDIPRLRFALAHIGWPWCDETIAVYGKFQMAYRARPDASVEMFIDTTPGTPPIYRREALTKLYTVGYDVERNVLFGSDGRADGYDATWARQWLARDRRICREVKLSRAAQNRYLSGNLLRFITGQDQGRAK